MFEVELQFPDGTKLLALARGSVVGRVYWGKKSKYGIDGGDKDSQRILRVDLATEPNRQGTFLHRIRRPRSMSGRTFVRQTEGEYVLRSWSKRDEGPKDAEPTPKYQRPMTDLDAPMLATAEELGWVVNIREITRKKVHQVTPGQRPTEPLISEPAHVPSRSPKPIEYDVPPSNEIEVAFGENSYKGPAGEPYEKFLAAISGTQQRSDPSPGKIPLEEAPIIRRPKRKT